MINIGDKINEERIKSVKLREVAFDTNNFKQTQKIREEQQKHYDKYLFFKNLKKALKESEVK